jgi:hypothetical protein
MSFCSYLCQVFLLTQISFLYIYYRQLGPVSEYMINAYCGDLAGTFAQLEYYGVLKPEDAQCFRVNTHLESGFFVLAAGAVLLALLNTFVMKAVRQYNREKDNSVTDGPKVSPSCGGEDDLAERRKTVHPVPVLFTDTFRWLLVREESNRGAAAKGRTWSEEPPLVKRETQVDPGDDPPVGRSYDRTCDDENSAAASMNTWVQAGVPPSDYTSSSSEERDKK